MRSFIIAAALVVVTATASFAQAPERYNPGPAKASTEAPAPKAEKAPAPKRDYQAEAQQRYSGWQEVKRQCYREAGLEEGKHFRLVADASKFIVNDRVYTDPKFNGNKVQVCNQ